MDPLQNSDSGDCSILVLLDLSMAFDTVDHSTLIGRLKNWVGISGMTELVLFLFVKQKIFCFYR